jgi:hypothetical protein
MHWSNTDFMYLVASDTVKHIGLPVLSPRVSTSNRPQPGVPFGLYSSLLIKLALKIVHAGNVVGERGIASAFSSGKYRIG